MVALPAWNSGQSAQITILFCRPTGSQDDGNRTGFEFGRKQQCRNKQNKAIRQYEVIGNGNHINPKEKMVNGFANVSILISQYDGYKNIDYHKEIDKWGGFDDCQVELRETPIVPIFMGFESNRKAFDWALDFTTDKLKIRPSSSDENEIPIEKRAGKLYDLKIGKHYYIN